MTEAEILPELQDIDRYLGNIAPDDDLGRIVVYRGRRCCEGAVLRKAQQRRAFLIRKLKRLHGVDYEAMRKAEQFQEAQEFERVRNEFCTLIEKVDPTYPVRMRLETLCREELCEDLLGCGKGVFPHLVHVWAELRQHPEQVDAILARFGLDYIDRDFFLDLMQRAADL